MVVAWNCCWLEVVVAVVAVVVFVHSTGLFVGG